MQAVEDAEALADDRHPDRQAEQDQQVRPGRRLRGVRRSARRGRSAPAGRRSTSRPSRRPSAARASGRPGTRASGASRCLHVPGIPLRQSPGVSRVRTAAGSRRARGLRVDERLARRRDPPGRLRGHRLARRPAGGRRARRPGRSPPTIPVGTPVFGVRFRLGVAGAALGLPAGEFADDSVPVADVWGPGVDERVAAGGLPALIAGVRERVLGAPLDPLARAAALRMAVPGRARLGAGLGVSERQLRRRFEDAVGYGPKTLARVLRFQRFLALASGGGELARLALSAGYAGPGAPDARVPPPGGPHAAELVAAGAPPAGERLAAVELRRRARPRRSRACPIRSSRAARRGVPSGAMNETIERAQDHVWSTSRVLEQRRFEFLFGDGDARRDRRRAGALQDRRRRLRLRARARRARADEPAAAHLDRARGARRRRHDRPRDLRSPADAHRARRRRARSRCRRLEPYARAPWWAIGTEGTLLSTALHLRAALAARRHARLDGRRPRRSAGAPSTRSRRRIPTRPRRRSCSSTRRATASARAPPPSGSGGSCASRGWSASSPRATRRARSTTRTTSPSRPDSLARAWFTDAEIEASLDHLAAQQRERRRLAGHVGDLDARDRDRVERAGDDRAP